MTKLFRICMWFLWALCPLLLLAQTPKKKITSAADLPHLVYEAPAKLIDLFLK